MMGRMTTERIMGRRLLRLPRALLWLALATCGKGNDGGGPSGAINISISTVSFSGVPGENLDPQTVSITPATGDELTGLEAEIGYATPPPSPWLSTSFDDVRATIPEPATLTLQVTGTDLPAGTYRATVTVRSPAAANAPLVNVSLTVETAAALALAAQPPATVGSGAPFPQAPVVQLQTEDGKPVREAGVEISVSVEGGGTLAGPSSVITNGEGTASFEGLSITAPAGEQVLLFTATGLTEVRSNPITITAGTATEIAASSITTQSAEVSTPVIEPPAVLVTDAAGNPVEGVPVSFTVAPGDGVISPTGPVPTNADGIAALTSWQLGPDAGDNKVTASVEGLSGSPVEFSATGTIGGVVPGPISAANSEVRASSSSFAAGGSITITVIARDAQNVPIGNASVTLESTGSNFQFGSTSLTTGTTGATLGRASTSYTTTKAEAKQILAHITANGVEVTPPPANVTVGPGTPNADASTVTASPTQVIQLANSSTITVTVKDVHGNVVGGKPVSLAFVGTSAGGVITQPSSTNPSGVTTGTLRSTTGGPYEVRATVGGGTPVPINQTASVTFLLTFTHDIEPLFHESFPNADPSGGFTSTCSSCHRPYIPGGSVPDLSFSHLTESHDDIPVVDPGNADGSLLILALEHNRPPGEQMPSATQRLPQSVIDLIRRWIDQEPTLRE